LLRLGFNGRSLLSRCSFPARLAATAPWFAWRLVGGRFSLCRCIRRLFGNGCIAQAPGSCRRSASRSLPPLRHRRWWPA
jgi:hypothetical protein